MRAKSLNGYLRSPGHLRPSCRVVVLKKKKKKRKNTDVARSRLAEDMRGVAYSHIGGLGLIDVATLTVARSVVKWTIPAFDRSRDLFAES